MIHFHGVDYQPTLNTRLDFPHKRVAKAILPADDPGRPTSMAITLSPSITSLETPYHSLRAHLDPIVVRNCRNITIKSKNLSRPISSRRNNKTTGDIVKFEQQSLE